MDEFAASARLLLETHGAWAGPIIGLLCFAESMAIIGLFVPATAAMLMIGGLAGSGLLDPVTVLAWAVAGSILGDALSYLLGSALGPRIYHRWPLNRHRPLVARARLYFRRYGFWTILIGRFLGPIRPTVPLVAGVVQMPQRPFQIANLLSALVWAPVMLAPGYLAARGVLAIDFVNPDRWFIYASAISVICIGLPITIGYWLNARTGARRRQRAASNGQ